MFRPFLKLAELAPELAQFLTYYFGFVCEADAESLLIGLTWKPPMDADKTKTIRKKGDRSRLTRG